MGNLITIGYLTSRKNPLIEFFLRTLMRELRGDLGGIQLIVVDFHLNEDPRGPRREWLKSLVKQIGLEGIDLCHTPPKPSVWQGKYRKTKNHHFAASNSRNTIFGLAKHDFVACVDDLSALLPGWMDNAMHARHHGYVVLGSYKKVLELAVSNEGDISCKEHPEGVDSRWNLGRATGIVESQGSMLFGCSFGLPIELALKVNGFDEICDGTGMEDVEFGCRLERAGAKFFYNRNMCTYESEEGHSWDGNTKFVRESKMTTSGLMSDWWIKNNRIDSRETWTIGNNFELRKIREMILSNTGTFAIPEVPMHDWRDGRPLSEL